MTHNLAQDDQEDKEQPLDPATEKIQARLRRMMMFSGLTLGLGIFAVFGAILYKVIAPGDNPSEAVSGNGVIAVEVGTQVESAAASDDSLTLSVVTSAGRRYIRRYHPGTGALIRQWEITFGDTPSVPQAQ
jgi:hypothetical protein